MERFNLFFNKLLSEFKTTNKLKEIRNPSGKLEWGGGFGVYTVFKKTIDFNNLLYVGLTGKYIREIDGSITLNSGSFEKRALRWTPYRFCESTKDAEYFRFTFRYGPKFGKVSQQSKVKYQSDAYKVTIPYRDLIIFTFDLSGNQVFSPSYLEAMILNEYWRVNGQLPPANNQL